MGEKFTHSTNSTTVVNARAILFWQWLLLAKKVEGDMEQGGQIEGRKTYDVNRIEAEVKRQNRRKEWNTQSSEHRTENS